MHIVFSIFWAFSFLHCAELSPCRPHEQGVCRQVPKNSRRGKVKLKIILRFLRKRPTTTYLYEGQDHPGDLTGYTDSDWAGCKLTRRSTSGGAIQYGSLLLLHYSRTQAGVALSSAWGIRILPPSGGKSSCKWNATKAVCWTVSWTPCANWQHSHHDHRWSRESCRVSKDERGELMEC